MKRASLLIAIAGFLGFITVATYAVMLWNAPTILRIAVGPPNSEDSKLVASLIQTFAREKQPVRLKMVATEGPAQSAEALKDQKADLAIIRSDADIPPGAATVAIMHRDLVSIITRGGSSIENLQDLRGKTVGILRGLSLNPRLLEFILLRNGISPQDVKIVPVRPRDVHQAAIAGQIDAIFLTAPVSGTAISRTFQDLTSDTGDQPRILAIPNAEAIAQFNPFLESATLLRGSLGGAQPKPEKDLETIAVTHRLFADREMKDAVIGDFTKAMFEVRQAISTDVPLAARIEAPNVESPGAFVIHPGASAYFEGERKSFIEQYGEWIYIGVMAVSLLGSLGAALMSRTIGQKQQTGTVEIDRMLLLLRRTRKAESLDVVDSIEREADDVFARTVEKAATSSIEETVMSAFTIALGELRSAIDERRRHLAQLGESPSI